LSLRDGSATQTPCGAKSDDYFLATMTYPALFALPRAPRWARFTGLGAACLLSLGCESHGASEPARPKVKEHPAFAIPKTPEMMAEPAPSERRVAEAPTPPPRDKKDWAANCKIQKGCSPEPKILPACDADLMQRPWVDVVSQADVFLGKEVAASGTIGLSLIKKTGAGACKPGTCCHTLEMQIVLVGEPAGSLPLIGLTCSGDDSTMCCAVPADGQAVVARGTLKKAPGGPGKWQLEKPDLCLIDNSPKH